MFTLPSHKVERRLQRLVWRLQSDHAIFIGTCVLVWAPGFLHLRARYVETHGAGAACSPRARRGAGAGLARPGGNRFLARLAPNTRAPRRPPPPPPSSLSLVFVKHYMTSAGAQATHRQRIAANGTYAKRHFAEHNDSA